MKDEALKLALECIEAWDRGCSHDDYWRDIENAITAIKEALAQPAQGAVAKPYAYEFARDNGDGTYSVFIERGDLIQIRPTVYEYARPKNVHKDHPIKELFDHPPVAQRQWVGLTDEEMKDSLVSVDAETKRLPLGMKAFAQAIEAKLKEKNT